MNKLLTLLFVSMFVFACTNTVEKNRKIKEGTKNYRIEKKDLPVELEQINLRINQRVPEISYTVLERSSDSVYLLDIYNRDSILVGQYNILPCSLSKEKVNEYEYWAFRSSCTIGLLHPKMLRFKNFVFRPSCGFHRQSDQELMKKFYLALVDAAITSKGILEKPVMNRKKNIYN